MQLHACVLEGKTLPQYARDWARIPIIPKTLLLPLSGVKTLLEKRVLLYSLPHSPQHFQSVKHCVFGEWNNSKIIKVSDLTNHCLRLSNTIANRPNLHRFLGLSQCLSLKLWEFYRFTLASSRLQNCIAKSLAILLSLGCRNLCIDILHVISFPSAMFFTNVSIYLGSCC